MISYLKSFMLSIIFFSLNLQSMESQNLKADLVIFSYDRPLQLYALLESLEKYVGGLETQVIIYRTSNDEFEKAYQEVIRDFPYFVYCKQQFVSDFKPLTLKAAFDSPSSYIIFAVDDIIIKDFINITQCIELIEKYRAYGFYPWLGKNITQCYSYNSCAQPMPQSMEVEKGIFAWYFCDGSYDWNYPHTVDFALYRKKDIECDLKNLEYTSPNTLEAVWAGQSKRIQNNIGLCFEISKSINLPLNRVSEFRNRHMNFMKPVQMLEVFNQKLKIDIQPLFKMMNSDPHTAYAPSFIERN